MADEGLGEAILHDAPPEGDFDGMGEAFPGEESGAPSPDLGENEGYIEEAEEEYAELSPEEQVNFDYESHPNAKLERIEFLDPTYAEHSASYTNNTPKEQLVLEYVENFRWQFSELYPHRAELFLCPPNECDVLKFVCTTIRPTQLEYKHLYDWDITATTIANFLAYESFHHPAKLPRHLPSPSFTLQMQAGDAVDMSTVLCSFLLGAGYDAYVVSGYAPLSITMKDETRTICPLLDVQPPPPPPEVHFLDDIDEKYKTFKLPDLDSKFLAWMAQREADKNKSSENDDQTDVEEVDDKQDVFYGKRVHSWVLILAGKREVPDNFYLEPSTGKRYDVDESPYLGIESIWNNTNYWVNMQSHDPRATETLRGISFDLKDTSKWEFIFLDQPPSALDAVLDLVEEEDGEDAGAPKMGIDHSKVTTDGGEQILDMPPSWVHRLSIAWDVLEYRCPGGEKGIDYKKANLEIFAEYKNPDGLVSRLTVFKDTACTIPKEIREEFAHRKDKLVWRHIFPLEKKTHEHFDPGRYFALKDHFYVEDERREFRFYSEARLDGKVKRVDHIGRKIFEVFTSRDDHLIYRSVMFDQNDSKPNKDKGFYNSQLLVGSDSSEMVVRKMTEKYERNPDVDAELDVSKRAFYVKEGRIRLDFHYGADHITASSRIFSKEGKSKIVQVDPFSKEPKPTLLLEEYTKLIAAEKECGQEIRNSDREAREILVARKREEESFENSLTVSIYDPLRNKTREDREAEEKDDDTDSKEPDYLAPFLLQFDKKKLDRKLTRDECIHAKNACLKALKERLIERAAIIQSRLDEENAALAKKQQAFQRNRDHVDKAEEEEYEQYCSDSMFKIQILEQRLARHEEQALQKYAEMDMKLRNDERLKSLYTN